MVAELGGVTRSIFELLGAFGIGARPSRARPWVVWVELLVVIVHA